MKNAPIYLDFNASTPLDPRVAEVMQDTLRDASGIASAGGVHFCSTQYGVAALGNIATRPGRRGHGLAKAVTARVCRSLLRVVPELGLNVESGNTPAIRCYRSLGFETAGAWPNMRWSLSIAF